MNRIISAILLLNILFLGANFTYAEGFTLSSPDISGQLANTHVFNGFGCSGDNISPKLKWKNAPKDTRSFAITVYDPDAPTGSGWWHWVIFDIPLQTGSLDRNSGNIEMAIAPKGSVQSITSFGKMGYGGACPPKGDTAHKYIFTIYALKIDKLGLDSKSMPAMVGFYLRNNVLAKASVITYYGR